MAKVSGAMHVARIKSSHVDKAGRRRDYQSVYLRRSFREGPQVKHEQLANLSALPEAAITAIEAVLAGATLVGATEAIRIESALPHGHVAAVAATARTLGLPALLGPVGRYHPGRRPGGARRVHRRDLRGDGLAARPPRRHRKAVGGTASGPGVQPVADRDVRPVLVVGDRAVLRPGRPRLLPRRQER